MNILVSIVSILILAYVIYMQIKNLSHYWDGNGQMKIRILFIIQVISLIIIALCDLFKFPSTSSIAVLVLAFNALSFYKNWDVAKPLVNILKKIIKPKT
jgi:hypothetical protein